MASTGRLAQTHKLLGIADQLARQTHFNLEECRQLVVFHQRMTSSFGPLDRLRFRDILHVVFNFTDDIMLDLTYKGFDRDNDGQVDEIEWTHGLSHMLRGSLQELIDFVYFVYDMNGDRSLAREELYHCMKGCMHQGFGVDPDEIEECEREIVELAMKKLDVDRDGQITFEDFQAAVINDPLLLQAVGPCLPPPKSLASFLALITFKYRSYSGCWAIPWSYADKTKKQAKVRGFATKPIRKQKSQSERKEEDKPRDIPDSADSDSKTRASVAGF